MKFKTDENLPVETGLLLQEAGYACDTVLDEALSGASDPTIAAGTLSCAQRTRTNPLTLELPHEYRRIADWSTRATRRAGMSRWIGITAAESWISSSKTQSATFVKDLREWPQVE